MQQGILLHQAADLGHQSMVICHTRRTVELLHRHQGQLHQTRGDQPFEVFQRQLKVADPGFRLAQQRLLLHTRLLDALGKPGVAALFQPGLIALFAALFLALLLPLGKALLFRLLAQTRQFGFQLRLRLGVIQRGQRGVLRFTQQVFRLPGAPPGSVMFIKCRHRRCLQSGSRRTRPGDAPR